MWDSHPVIQPEPFQLKKIINKKCLTRAIKSEMTRTMRNKLEKKNKKQKNRRTFLHVSSLFNQPQQHVFTSCTVQHGQKIDTHFSHNELQKRKKHIIFFFLRFMSQVYCICCYVKGCSEELPSRWQLCCNLDGLKRTHYDYEWNDNLEEQRTKKFNDVQRNISHREWCF